MMAVHKVIILTKEMLQSNRGTERAVSIGPSSNKNQ